MKIPGNIMQTPNGRLVLIGGAHSTLDMFHKDVPPNISEIEAFRKNIEYRKNYCDLRGVTFNHYVMPDALVVLGMMNQIPFETLSYYERHFHVPGEYVRYPKELLLEDDKYLLKTDTHYSPVCYARMALEIFKDITLENPVEVFERALRNSSKIDFVGDLAVQCTPAPTESIDKPFQIDGLRYATNGLEFGNSGIIDLAISENAISNRCLLIFGDSFFRGMIGELSRYWNKIVFLRTPFFHPRIFEAVCPDDVLTGNAERYLSGVMEDSDAPDVFAMPLMSGRPTKPTKDFGILFNELFDVKKLNSVSGFDSFICATTWPGSSSSQDIEEQMAFALWIQSIGDLSKLDNLKLSILWRSERSTWRKKAAEFLIVLQKRDVFVGKKS